MELEKFRGTGGRTIVDLTPIGRERDPTFVRLLATRADVNVVLGTGYAKEGWLPETYANRATDDLARTLIGELTTGIAGTDIRAGVIGEIGISRSFSAFEHRSLEAAAIAQRATGAPIAAQLEIGASVREVEAVLATLESSGANMSRVAIAHVVCAPASIEVSDVISRAGAWVMFDLFGQERGGLSGDLIALHPEVQVSSIRGYLDRGLGARMLLSQDVNHVQLLTVNGGDGYAHLARNVAPRLAAYGTSPREWETLSVQNPRRFLTGG
jgi:phosphotriesterase-related protein